MCLVRTTCSQVITALDANDSFFGDGAPARGAGLSGIRYESVSLYLEAREALFDFLISFDDDLLLAVRAFDGLTI